MKKTVFAAQVFALIAMLPIVVILEMNHVSGGSSENNAPSGSIKKTENTMIGLPEKAKDKRVSETFSITLETFLLKTAY